MDYQQLHSRWQGYFGIAPAIYRIIAFAVAAAQIFLFPEGYHSVIPAVSVVSAVGLYTLAKAFYPLRWYAGDILSYSVLGADVAICILLILSTGGINSAFLPYSLAPVLTVALVADRKLTLGIAGLFVASALAIQLAIPLTLPFPMGPFLLYAMAVSLTAILPYLTNANLRQELHYQEVLQERQRLSREIHDGIAQTLASFRWRAEVIRRRLAEMGIHLDEVTKLESLAEKAHHDARESLELLRAYSGNSSLWLHLEEYLKQLSQDSGIGFHLDIDVDGLELEANVELELVRICQEAVTNIRKHSGAHSARVELSSGNDHLELSIVDDGCGFDALAYYKDGTDANGHGLVVMRERAQSIGGDLVVLSRPGSGTEVKLHIPTRERRRHR